MTHTQDGEEIPGQTRAVTVEQLRKMGEIHRVVGKDVTALVFTSAADQLEAMTRERDEAANAALGGQELVDQLREELSTALALERVAKLERCVSFFASAIKSGEPWTEHCESELGQALAPPTAPGGEGKP